MAGAVPLGFACGGVSEDVEEAGIRWGATAEGGGEGVQAVAANACVSFLLARCARGGCKEISGDEGEILTEKGSGVEISREKCSGVEISREK